ncbi:hypothetical protein [Nocardia abscessus]|uniref:hypothetical protein n=1 Tax=Nocardia abscessus TaxID=120957 RepID=UPI00245707F3|nr:hypothetical protein [Nocardia abscessus]
MLLLRAVLGLPAAEVADLLDTQYRGGDEHVAACPGPAGRGLVGRRAGGGAERAGTTRAARGVPDRVPPCRSWGDPARPGRCQDGRLGCRSTRSRAL